MNLPNKITIARVFLIPVFLLCLMIDWGVVWMPYVAAAVFAIASLTDLVDGKLARKLNLVTNFGKFMDPLADKLLVCSTLIAFVEMGKLQAWIVIIIIAREFIISGFRLVASDAGVVIAASMWGKVKTTVQMIMIELLILKLPIPYMDIVELVFVYAALALTLISLIDYIAKNVKVLNTTNNK